MAFQLRFHWSPARPTRDISTFVECCRQAERAGMDSIEADPDVALEAASETGIALRVLHDPRLAGRTSGRLIVRWPVEHADVAATGLAMARCREDLPGVRLDVEGDTADAAWLAIQHADRLFRCADRLDQTYADALPVLHMGTEVGLSAFVIARGTRDEAVAAAGELFGVRGVLTGSFAGIAEALDAYRRKGISDILLRGRPGHDDLGAFAEGVLPRVRELEQGRAAVA
jgi:alkanesulfonate monooxygenase SsuD/methylene tetrahydromethanopterin reductase-like flavin-dependent oxidoreductase (luciferase family)